MSSRIRNSQAMGWAMIAAFAILPLTACGSDSPAGPTEEQGTMEAVVRDNPSTGSAAMMAAGGESADHVSGEFQGQVRIEVEVDGAWQTVSGLGNLNAEVQLEGGESVAGSTTVEARTYDRVRIIVSNANADVDAGSEIGAGPITVGVSLTIAGGNDVVIEHNQPVTVEANGTTSIVLDLNSSAWLTENAISAGAVTSAAFESAAMVVVQ